MTFLRLCLACVYAGALTASLQAQAAVEYAAKGAGSALSNASDRVHFGVCPLNSSLIPCIHEHYPVPFYVAAALVCLVFWSLFRPKRRV